MCDGGGVIARSPLRPDGAVVEDVLAGGRDLYWAVA